MFTYNNTALNGRLVNISSLIPQNPPIQNSNLLSGILPASHQLLLSANVNNVSNHINNIGNSKDSQWLTLEVCKDYQRNTCSKSEIECQLAHPPGHLDVQNGRIMCCYDSIKGNCHRIKPPCKYYHPPQHLKDVLIQNGKNNLVMKNLLQQQSQHHHLTLAAAANMGIGAARIPPNPPLSISTPLENSKLSPAISGISTAISNRSSTPLNSMEFKASIANDSIPLYSSTGNLKTLPNNLASSQSSISSLSLPSSYISPDTISTAVPVTSPAISQLPNLTNISRKRTFDTHISPELDSAFSKTDESSPAKQRLIMPNSNTLDPSNMTNPHSAAFLLANQAAAARQNLYLASTQNPASNASRFTVPISNYMQNIPHQFLLASSPNAGYSLAPLAATNPSLSSMLPNSHLGLQSQLLQTHQTPGNCTSPPGSALVNPASLGIPMVNPLLLAATGINPTQSASSYSLTQHQQQQLMLSGIMGRPVNEFPSSFH